MKTQDINDISYTDDDNGHGPDPWQPILLHGYRMVPGWRGKLSFQRSLRYIETRYPGHHQREQRQRRPPGRAMDSSPGRSLRNLTPSRSRGRYQYVVYRSEGDNRG
ncbi:MAG: hypothetical protein MZV63_16960 [Marinilabiliales bacterium]|nr:hypothetical protein [Marinilabiliales bacterium]